MTEYKLVLTTALCSAGPVVCARRLVKSSRRDAQASTHPHSSTRKMASNKLYSTQPFMLTKENILNWDWVENWVRTHTHTHTHFIAMNESFTFRWLWVSSRAEGLLKSFLSSWSATSPAKIRLMSFSQVWCGLKQHRFLLPLHTQLAWSGRFLMFKVQAKYAWKRLFSCYLT